MNIIDCEQGTREWLSARAGLVTASRIKTVMCQSGRGGGPSKTREDYKRQLVCEILTGYPVKNFLKTPAMEHGNKYEPDARDAYRLMTGFNVTEVGLVRHPSIEMAAASPDGVVDEDGLLEIKCPSPETHDKYCKLGAVPAAYLHQVMWQLACCERKWVDFVSFNPFMTGFGRIHIVRVYPDVQLIKEMERTVLDFAREVMRSIPVGYDLSVFCNKFGFL